MWIHIPLNAHRIMREESMGRYLKTLFEDYVFDELHPNSQLVVKYYIGSNDELKLTEKIWPTSHAMIKAGSVIQNIEIGHNIRKFQIEKLLQKYELDQESRDKANTDLRSKLGEWKVSDHKTTAELEAFIRAYSQNLRKRKRKEYIQSQILYSNAYQQLFLCFPDSEVFYKTVEFKILCQSSLSFQKYIRNLTDLDNAVDETIQIISEYMQNCISKEAVSVIGNCLTRM
jgi:hypothetical protein